MIVPPKVPPSPIAPPRVLLVEDSPRLASSLAVRLMAVGYDVAIADNDASALDLLRDGPTALFVFDLAMPVQPALDAALRLQRLAPKPAVPFLLLSPAADAAFRTRARLLGAADVLFKPVTQQALCEAIDRAILARRRATATGPAPAATAGDAAPTASPVRSLLSRWFA